MKKLLLLLLSLLILISCSKSSIKLVSKKDSQKNKKTEEEIKTIDHLDYDIPTNEFVYLFFNKSYFVNKPVNKTNTIKHDPGIGNPEDYKAVIDWQVEGDGRYIKLENKTTGKVFIVKEGDTRGEAILLERNLFYYKFKIRNTIIKVKR
jgi:hypothetical protein